MIALLCLAIMATLCAIAALHAAWGLAVRWPGHDEATLADMVIGKTRGNRMPSPPACFAVAGAILAGAVLVALVGFAVLPDSAARLAKAALWAFTAVFVARGIAGYVPAIWQRSAGTRFAALNTRYYSPLCLLVGAGLIAIQIGR